jgi:NAD-dependent DNA ligase
MSNFGRKHKEPKVGYYALFSESCQIFYQPNNQHRISIWSDENLSLKAGDKFLVVDLGHDEKNRSVMKLLIRSNVVNVPMHLKNLMLFMKPTNKLEGKSFCITGKLYYERKFYESLIEINGGSYKNSMNSNINFLLTNGSHQTTKIEKAKNAGSLILSEQKFWELIDSK